MTQHKGTNSQFVEACQHLLSESSEVYESSPRGMKCLETLSYNFSLENPRNRIVSLKARKTSLRYLLAEFIWYLSGSNLAAPIAEYAPFWSSITDDGYVNSNYGYRLFGYSPKINYNQWQTVKTMLINDPETRQAVMHINSSYDYEQPSKDVPCTMYLHWFIRNRNLNLQVRMRSNDLIMGYTNDLFQFSMLQELMVLELQALGVDVKLGTYHHVADSLHVYERHFDMIKDIVAESVPEEFNMIPMELNSTDRINLIEVERIWRVDHKLAKTAPLSQLISYQSLSPYWQRLIDVCFLGAPVELIAE